MTCTLHDGALYALGNSRFPWQNEIADLTGPALSFGFPSLGSGENRMMTEITEDDDISVFGHETDAVT
jgi:hypothetical protein